MRRLILTAALGATVALATPADAGYYTPLVDGPRCKPFEHGAKGNPYWARQRHMTVFVDSVLLSGFDTISKAKPCWRVQGRGRPALMVRLANGDLRKERHRVAKLVVIGLGYNSLWERNRRNFRKWAKRFDREARALMGTLTELGAKQFVWVTLREPTPETVPPSARDELGQYSWYFPWVNDRLYRLDRRRDDLVLADWAEASRKPGLTYDSIHLNETGAKLMAKTIRKAILREARRQAAEPPDG